MIASPGMMRIIRLACSCVQDPVDSCASAEPGRPSHRLAFRCLAQFSPSAVMVVIADAACSSSVTSLHFLRSHGRAQLRAGAAASCARPILMPPPSAMPLARIASPCMHAPVLPVALPLWPPGPQRLPLCAPTASAVHLLVRRLASYNALTVPFTTQARDRSPTDIDRRPLKSVRSLLW